tara:strand:- start:28 stop:168 length:141 start_codon:yes stop_codon:yes gene_type:complete
MHLFPAGAALLHHRPVDDVHKSVAQKQSSALSSWPFELWHDGVVAH